MKIEITIDDKDIGRIVEGHIEAVLKSKIDDIIVRISKDGEFHSLDFWTVKIADRLVAVLASEIKHKMAEYDSYGTFETAILNNVMSKVTDAEVKDLLLRAMISKVK